MTRNEKGGQDAAKIHEVSILRILGLQYWFVRLTVTKIIYS